jgi:hypothetical protein
MRFDAFRWTMCWQGAIAETAKTHAGRIARSLVRRLLDVEWTPPNREVVT